MMPDAVADQLEPAARDMVGDVDDLTVAAASIAISLKRLADLAPPGFDFASINNNIEQLAWGAGRSFEQGRRTDR